MVTFTCPTCGEERTGKRRRCYQCTGFKQTDESKDKIRQALKGVKHSDERVANITAAIRQARAEGRFRRDPGSHTRGKPSPKAVPAGSERVVKDGRVQVKCDDGKWRYRSRIVWAAANGPIPPGRIIHHKNEDPMDDDLGNLQMVTRAEHAAIHSTPEVARERQRRAVEARKRNRSY
jgi:HNH endonuclease